MKLFFHGHEERYAIEQLLFSLFSGEKPQYDGTAPEENSLVSRYREDGGFCTATARLRRNGRESFGAERLPIPPQETEVERTRRRRRALQRAFYHSALPQLQREPPWGMLTGVRPVKPAVRALWRGESPARVEAQYRGEFRVAAQQTRQTLACARAAHALQQKLGAREVSLYVSIPFCPSRCAYCSFISAGASHRYLPAYLEGLFSESAAAAAALRAEGVTVGRVYVGGGTPTVLSAEQLQALLSRLRRDFSLPPEIEWTVEAGRPDTITREKLRVLRAGGVSRVSVNPQTFCQPVLDAIGRRHSAAQTHEACALVREVGGFCLNMDLIAGLPGDSFAGFQDSLEQCLRHRPENLTLHTLAVKRGSALRAEAHALPGEAETERMVLWASERLAAAGYAPYYLYRQKYMGSPLENVGYTLPGWENAYNLCMMEELQSVLALGAGGVSKSIDYAQGRLRRHSCPKYPQEYLAALPRILEEKSVWQA